MQQTQSALLSELEFGIKHLPPTLPEEKQKEIDGMVAELKALGEKADDGAMRDVMVATGKIEWPYRQAYKGMVMECCSQTEHQMMIENLRPATRKKFKNIGGDDVSIHELVRSRIFEEQLTPEERYEVQEASLNARLQMIEFMKEVIVNRPKDLEKGLAKARADQKKLEDAIDQLEALTKIDADWAPDIQAKVDQFKLGWSISEPDVLLGDVDKEIEYWQETFGASESEV
ncbi:MAG TPA: hypothetical protein QF873_03910 [Patescibacteria group bacterium]|nr:hypothetical protein [Patescibacteria group bacterium]